MNVKKLLNSLVLVFLLVLGVLCLPPVRTRMEKAFYPCKYSALVEQYAAEYDLDPLLVYSFIRTESGFDPAATSSVNARGLMQMTEETFLWMRSKLAAGENVTFDDLYDPAVSLRYGCYYLHLCLQRYNGDVATAAAAYHSGWGTVDTLLQTGKRCRASLITRCTTTSKRSPRATRSTPACMARTKIKGQQTL